MPAPTDNRHRGHMPSQRQARLLIACCLALSLAACGGGGGGSAAEAVAEPAASNRWTMDAFNYNNGGLTNLTGSLPGDSLPYTLVEYATARASGAGQGAYAGSTIAFTFSGSGAGTYSVVGNSAALVALAPGAKGIVVDAIVGWTAGTGATRYAATAGTVVVTQDAAGKYHFTTPAPLPAAKARDLLGGVAGAPATMTITLFDVNG